jgi:hypothetical protein
LLTAFDEQSVVDAFQRSIPCPAIEVVDSYNCILPTIAAMQNTLFLSDIYCKDARSYSHSRYPVGYNAGKERTMVRKALIAAAFAAVSSACAVSVPPGPPANLSPSTVRTAWLSKGHYVWQPLVPAVSPAPVVRHVKIQKKDPTTSVATVPRVVACDLEGFAEGCATY